MNAQDTNCSRLAQILDDFMAARAAGREPDVPALLAGHPELADELRDCLASLRLLSAAAAGTNETVDDDAGPTAADEAALTLGDFQIVREVGRGGMGVVYEARQLSLDRRVALKVLPFAGMLDPRQLQRFKNEAQAAAQLDHPHIVDVIAVGCERAVHYYAMRFVEGWTLAQVIGELRRSQESEVRSQEPEDDCKLQNKEGQPPAIQNPKSKIQNRRSTAAIAGFSTESPREYYRTVAALLADVADALDYSHQLGVVHRDVKPSNVLVDTQGKAWITDFGLALVESRTEMTVTGDLVGTLRYMSPEQATGNRRLLDHRTDIYSLGATLYELLALRPAVGSLDRQELLHQIAEVEPTPPRLIRKSVPRDLETIALKALEKEPWQRYASAGDLAADLRRFVAGEAIRARPLSGRQRVVRWTQRHVGLVYSIGAGLLIALTVSVVAGMAIYKSNQDKDAALDDADAQRKLAEQHFAEAGEQRALAEDRLKIATQAVDDYLNRVTEDPDLKQSDFNPLRKKLLESAVPYYQKLTEQQPGDAAAEAERGRAYGRLASVRHEMGENAEALADFEQERSIFAKLAADFPTVPEYRERLSASHNNLSRLLVDLGRLDEAEAAFRSAFLTMESLVADFPSVSLYRRDLAVSQDNLGGLMRRLGRQDEADAARRAALAIREKLVADFPIEPQYRQDLAGSHNNLGILFSERGQHEKAEAAFRAALTIREKLAAEFPNSMEYRHDLACSHNNLGNLLKDLTRRSEAESAYRAGLDIQEKLAADFSTVPKYRVELVAYHMNFANLLRREGRREEAESAYSAALAIAEKLSFDFPTASQYRRSLATVHNVRGDVLIELGRRAEAEAAYRAALAVREKLAADFPTAPHYAVDLGGSYYNLGKLLADNDRASDALECYGNAIRVIGAVVEQEKRPGPARQFLMSSHWGRARALDKLNRHAEAIDDWQRAIELVEGPIRRQLRILRAVSLIRAGDHAQAMSEASELAGDDDLNAGLLYDLACVCSLAAAAAGPAAANLSPGSEMLGELYALRALDLLRRATAQGYKDVAHIRIDTDLDALRGRDDFKQLIADLEAKQQP